MKYKTTNTVSIIANIILLTLFSCYSFAQIEYISLHEVESSKSNALSVKLNVVEKDQILPLKFVLSNQQKRTTLSYQRINNYMLRLKGPSNVSGRAVIHVYQLEKDVWRRVKGINISGSLTPLSVSTETISTKVKSATPLSAKNSDLAALKVTPLSKYKKEKTGCILTRQRKETLWSLASRYKDQWHIDIFSAMLAIYKSNITKFSKQHIGQLMDKTTLNCPNKETIAAMGTKAQMKVEFNRLHAQPVK